MFKKIVPINFNKLKNLKMFEKILFVSLAIIDTKDTATDPYTLETFQIKLTTDDAPKGILLKVFCFPEHNIINIIKCNIMSPHESNALQLAISRNEMGDNNVENEATILNEAYKAYQEDCDCDHDCIMALEVNLFTYLFIYLLFQDIETKMDCTALEESVLAEETVEEIVEEIINNCNN